MVQEGGVELEFLHLQSALRCFFELNLIALKTLT